MWDHLALTDHEAQIVQQMQTQQPHAPQPLRVAVLGDWENRYPMVRIRDAEHPAPLRRLGTSALWACCVAMGLHNAQRGLLLLNDAAANLEPRHSTRLWTHIMEQAVQQQVQVLAVTRSTDSVRAFRKAMQHAPRAASILRMEPAPYGVSVRPQEDR